MHISPTLCISRKNAYAIHPWAREKFLVDHKIKTLRSTRKVVCVEHTAVVTTQLFNRLILEKFDPTNQPNMRTEGYVSLDGITDKVPEWSERRRMLMLNDRLSYLYLKR